MRRDERSGKRTVHVTEQKGALLKIKEIIRPSSTKRSHLISLYTYRALERLRERLNGSLRHPSPTILQVSRSLMPRNSDWQSVHETTSRSISQQKKIPSTKRLSYLEERCGRCDSLSKSTSTVKKRIYVIIHHNRFPWRRMNRRGRPSK